MFSIITNQKHLDDILRIKEVVEHYEEDDCTLEQAEILWMIVSQLQWISRLTLPKKDKDIYFLVCNHIINDADYLEDLVKNKDEDIEDVDDKEEVD
jgi:hypothetical protein